MVVVSTLSSKSGCGKFESPLEPGYGLDAPAPEHLRFGTFIYTHSNQDQVASQKSQFVPKLFKMSTYGTVYGPFKQSLAWVLRFCLYDYYPSLDIPLAEILTKAQNGVCDLFDLASTGRP